MKTLLIVLTLAGIVPVSGHAQTRAPGPLSFGLRAGRASLHDGMPAAAPKSRARTLDLRASGPGYNSGCGSDPAKWNSANSNEVDANGIDYCVTPTGVYYNWTIESGTIYCGAQSGYIANPGKKPKPLSIKSQDTCEMLYNWGMGLSNNYQWLASYDSLKKFVETCPNAPDAPKAFYLMGMDVQELEASDTSLWHDFQGWLRSVLYLNTTNPAYFCQCVQEINPRLYFVPDVRGQAGMYQTDTSLALLYWVINHTSCDTPFVAHLYWQSRLSQYQTWQTDSSIGNHYPFDTTLPTMHDLGLDTLLDRHFLYADVYETFHGIITNAAASPNPVSSGTIISFGIRKEAYVKIEVFDLLGNRVSSAGFESLFEPGNKAVPISLVGLPSGTYFARIVTAYGEVQTVKLVKE